MFLVLKKSILRTMFDRELWPYDTVDRHKDDKDDSNGNHSEGGSDYEENIVSN
jgi:hypothetical protein